MYAVWYAAESTPKAWYASDFFWIVFTAIAGVAGTGLIVAVSIRLAPPKRRLAYRLNLVAPIINPNADLRGGLEVRRNDAVLVEPTVLELTISSKSRSDIPSATFDNGRPLIFDVGVPIVELLSARTSLSSKQAPHVDVSDTTLRMRPTLIKKREKMSFSLLVSGVRPSLSCPDSPLIDVDLVEEAAGGSRADYTFGFVVLATLSLFLVTGFTASTLTYVSDAKFPNNMDIVGTYEAGVADGTALGQDLAAARIALVSLIATAVIILISLAVSVLVRRRKRLRLKRESVGHNG